MPQNKRGRGRKPTRPRGSVYWHAASERWCAQTPPDRRGRRRSRYFPADHEDAAWAWLDDQLAALDDGRDIFAGTERLATYLERWVTRCAADPERDWAPSTERTYRWAIRQVDTLARVPVEDLTRRHIDEFIAQLAGHGLGRRSISVVRTMIRSALSDLVDDDVIAQNPVRPTRRRRRGDEIRPPVPTWSEADVRKLLQAAARQSTQPAMWWLELTLGLRNGQLRALERSDVNLERRELLVKATASQSGRTLHRPKNKTGHRIHLEDHLVAALRDHLTRPIPISGRLFSREDGSPLSESDTNEELRALCRLARIDDKHRVHSCRHWAASAMLANGYAIPLVAHILGHANPGTTLSTYAHVLPAKPVERPRHLSDILPWRTSNHAPQAPIPPVPAVPSAVPAAILSITQPLPTLSCR